MRGLLAGELGLRAVLGGGVLLAVAGLLLFSLSGGARRSLPWLNTQLARGSDVFTLKETACGCARTFGHQLGFQLL